MSDDLYNNPDVIYDSYLEPDIQPLIQQIIPTTAIVNLNGLSGPTITLAGGASGFSYAPAGATITLVSPLTTKGDIYTRDATTGARLAVGTDGQILTADSASANGIKWAANSVPSGAWTAYTPTWTNLSVGNGTVSAAYFQVGKYVAGRVTLVVGGTTSITGTIIFTLPITAISYPGTAGKQKIGDGVCYAASSSGNPFNLDINWNSTTTAIVRAIDSAGANTFQVNANATVPTTWAATDELQCQFYYQAA